MIKTTLVSAAALLALTAGVACNVHDNTINATANIPDAKVSITADTDVDNVMPATSVPMTVTVEHVTLVEPSAMLPAGHESDAGHFEFHIDDEMTTAVLVTAQTNVQVPIPAETKPGKHKVICRVHKHDGEPTTTKFEVDITVKASVTTTTTTSGTAGTSGSAGTTGTAGTSGAAGTGADAGTTVTTTTTVEVDASVMGTVTN